MRWGLFGGTFDPIHFGHLRAACELAGILNLDRVVFIPSASPPHKTGRVITPFEQRVQMTHLAIKGNPRFCVSDVENLREGKSYSIETVRYFLSKNPADATLYFITGQDAFDAITTWRDWESLLGLCHFVVMTRPGYENKGLVNILPADFAARYVYDEQRDGFQNPQGKYIFFRKTTFLDISSSDIRAQVQSGESIRYLTPDAVIRYIENHKLYSE
jgi:nicotinate-nucleotide adenylyltransferase